MKTLSAQEIMDISKELNVPINKIFSSDIEDNYLVINGYGYKIVSTKDINAEILDWIDSIGDAEYLFSVPGFPCSFSDVLKERKEELILNHSLFKQHCIDKIKEEYDSFSSDYTSFEDFVKNHLYLEIEDLQSISKLWCSEIMPFVSFSDIEEFKTNFKSYGLDRDQLNASIATFIMDYDTLGDYGLEGKIILDEHILYKKDL